MGRHLTPAERTQLGTMLADAGLHEVVATVAQWISTYVADFATADRLATELRRIGRELGALEAKQEAARTRAEAAPAPVARGVSDAQIVESINETTPVIPPWNGWCTCPLTRRAPKQIATHGVFCERCGRWVQPLGTLSPASRKRAPAPDETFCPTCKGEGACGWPEGAPLTVRCTRCDGYGCVPDPIAMELISKAGAQAAREGRPVTVKRKGRDLATVFPDGATCPALQYPLRAP